MHEVKVTIRKDGTTVNDFSGFVGPTCLAEAERLRQLLAELGIESEQIGFQAKPELDSVLNVTQQDQRAAQSQEG